MNSYEILKSLRRLLNNRNLDAPSLEVIRTAINHIVGQDRENYELREDITDVSIPDESS